MGHDAFGREGCWTPRWRGVGTWSCVAGRQSKSQAVRTKLFPTCCFELGQVSEQSGHIAVSLSVQIRFSPSGLVTAHFSAKLWLLW